MTHEANNKTFWEHAHDLRNTLLKCFIVSSIGILIALFFYKEIFQFLQAPLNGEKLFILGPVDGITTTFKVCFFLGLTATSPFTLYFLLNFIAPAIDPKFYRLMIPFLTVSLFFMFLGFSLAYFITIPIANQYLMLFNQDIGLNLWSLSNYLDYTIVLMMGNGLSFEMAVIAIFLVHFQILTAKQLITGRRYFIVSAFIVSAILTPPDVLTQIMLAIPLIILYECIILYATLKTRLNTKPVKSLA
jgi:sec-independent protein translocase protein TatC